jgi:serine O-acetyltransferase
MSAYSERSNANTDALAAKRAFWRERRARHPRLWEALVADARVAALNRDERADFSSRLDAALQIVRLAWTSDGFLAQALYRLKARLQALGVPVLPRLAHRLAIAVGQVAIGDPVVVAAGVYIAHGQTVIDGITEIGAGCVIAPFTTIGLRAGHWLGPTLEPGVEVGTGARLLGEFRVGAGARIGANAVVIRDVPPGVTVVGVPARPLPATAPSSGPAVPPAMG